MPLSCVFCCVIVLTVLGLAKEVVSVYNENFTTPPGRFGYFIEVQRCVKAYEDNPGCLTMPKDFEKITIVVPDVTNETIFYKYVVYNHTSCGCGNLDQWKLRDDREERGTVGLQQIMCENWIAVVSSDLQPLNAKCFTTIIVFDHAVANSTK